MKRKDRMVDSIIPPTKPTTNKKKTVFPFKILNQSEESLAAFTCSRLAPR